MAGISLNLIAGSNGIMERATKAADTYDEAKVKESLELSNAEMLIDCLGGGDLTTDLYDYIKERCEQNANKTAETSNGKYWIDTDGKFYYTDNDTNRTVELGKDTNGAPMIIGTGNSNGGGEEQEEIKKGVGTDVIKPESDYGTKVNYSANGINDWKVFLNDGTNIYLIASDYVPNSGLDCAEGITTSGDYVVTGNSRDGLINWMTTNLYWSEYARGYIGATATGGPTLEQFWASYNGKYGTEYSAEYQDLTSHEGYSNSLYFPHTSSLNNCHGYWLPTPNSSNANGLQAIYWFGFVGNNGAGDANYATRPLVKLPTNTVMSWKGDAWDLVEKATERITPENYGDKIQYSANGVEDWKIFLNDGKNVYLIASDYVPNSGMTITSDIYSVGGYSIYGNNRDGMVNWMKTEANWSNYATGCEGATVTGGPTIEQFLASYNGKYGTNYSKEDSNLFNQVLDNDILYFPYTTGFNDTYGQWLASNNMSESNKIYSVPAGNTRIDSHNYTGTKFGIRPLVKLPADARVVEQDGVWKIRGVATTEVQIPNYGDKVKYSANGVEDWKVFLNDGTNVYLISSECVPISGMKITADVITDEQYSVAGAGSSREGLIGWMRAEENWANYASGFNKATAIGGPTSEQFWASYNGTYGTNYSGQWVNLSKIHEAKDELYFPHKNKACYWLPEWASRLYYRVVNIVYWDPPYIGDSTYSDVGTCGIRPLVKLPANAKASRNSDKTWTFRE